MKTNNILILLCIIYTNICLAQAKTPKLIVGIVVDQMRYEYLKTMEGEFDGKGFAELIKEGYQFHNHKYDYIPTVTAAGHATIATGAYPAKHGIVGNSFYDRTLNKQTSCVGNASKTAGLLQKETFAEWLEKQTGGVAKTYSISWKDRAAILSLGNGGDLAIWYDKKQGNWATLSKDSQTKTWLQEAIDKDKITYDNGKKFYEFIYAPESPKRLMALALEFIRKEKLGQDDTLDFLNISFSTTDYVGHRDGPRSPLLKEIYREVSKQIHNLIVQLDSSVGRENYIVYLTSDHGVAEVPEELEAEQISAKRISGYGLDSLISLFAEKLKGKYPQMDLEHFSNLQLFFNTDLSAMDYATITQELNEYLKENQLNAFLKAVNVKDSLNNAKDDFYVNLFSKSYHKQRSGQIWLLLSPNVILSYGSKTTHFTHYDYDTHVPLLFFGYTIPHGESFQTTSPIDIAPTIRLLASPDLYSTILEGNTLFPK